MYRAHGLGVLIVAIATWLAWTRPGVWACVVAMAATAVVTWLLGWRGRPWRLMLFAVGVCVAAVDYLAWRTTVVAWPMWYIGVPLVLAELHAALQTVGMHVGLFPRQEVVDLREGVDPSTKPIFVFIPTVDEGPLIVSQTVAAVKRAAGAYQRAHPRAQIRIVVCNDGGVAAAPCSPQVIDVSRRLGVACVTRTVGGGAKAGNIENARRVVGAGSDSVLVIFDADQVPSPIFFEVVMEPFRDPRVGWVQTGQFYRNRTNPVARWADDQQSLFYRLLCPSKSSQNAAFICGTNVAIKAAALDEIGGMPTDSVTEDFAASIRLAHRWTSVYVPGVHATGLGPIDLPSYLKQQERWARGTLAALVDHFWDVVIPRRTGMDVRQRVQYGLAMTHYLSGVRDLVFVIAPVVFVLTGLSGVRGATLGSFLQHFVPYYLLSTVAFWNAAWRTTSWRGLVMGFVSTPALVRATWLTLVGRRGKFTLTPKRRTVSSAWRTARPYLVALFACATALVASLTVRRGGATLLAAFWLAFLVIQLLACLWLVRADVVHGRREAAAQRERAAHGDGPAIIRSESSGALPAGLRRRHRLQALVLVGILLLGSGVGVAQAVARERGHTPVAAAPRLGQRPLVGFAGADHTTLPAVAEHVRVRPNTIARTVEIADRVDQEWLRQARAAGVTPWLTLQLTRNNVCDLTCSLTAIRNGVNDAALRLWAQQARDSGVGFYLSLLPHLDRNYAASSAVAKGGIPADAAPAWSHIRQIFRDAGASNVSFVWSVGDPVHDAAFRPPANDYDAVAVTIFNYPRTTWPDAETMFRRVAATHPGKPQLALISAAGSGIRPATSKPAWIASLQAAVTRPDAVAIAAVVYQETGPAGSVQSAEGAQAWSILSDPASTAAFQALASALGAS